jgi:hypothetical protein
MNQAADPSPLPAPVLALLASLRAAAFQQQVGQSSNIQTFKDSNL